MIQIKDQDGFRMSTTDLPSARQMIAKGHAFATDDPAVIIANLSTIKVSKGRRR